LACRPNNTFKWIVDADIKGCFDNISHKHLLKTIGNFPARTFIKEWLKAGFVDNNVFNPTESGTPQGGIISPLLANIALHGMEKALGVKYSCRGESIGKRMVVRYADDFVILCQTKDDAMKAKRIINYWLSLRGLELSEEKTKVVHITEGFDFLGINTRQYKVSNTKTGYKTLQKPSKEFIKSSKAKLKEAFLSCHGQSAKILLDKINPIIRGISSYLKPYVSSETFSELDSYLFLRQCRYASRMHPNKGTSWKNQKYWGRLNLSRPNDQWVFGDKVSGAYMLKFRWTKIDRHVIIKGSNSPDDPTLQEYWKKRWWHFCVLKV
jgi:RNA-directed DNA polymerase